MPIVDAGDVARAGACFSSYGIFKMPVMEVLTLPMLNQLLSIGEMKVFDRAVHYWMFKLFSSGSGGLSFSDGIK